MNNQGWESGEKMTESVRKQPLGIKILDWSVYLLAAAGAVCVMIGAQYLAVYALSIVTYVANINFSVLEGTVTFVYSIIAIPFLLLYLKLIRPKGTPLCMNGKLDIAQKVFIVVIAFGLMGMVTIYLIVANKIAASFAPLAEQVDDYYQSVDRYAVVEASEIPVFDHILNLIGVCILAPITEELTFRVGVLDTLLKKIHPVAAVLLSGVAFGVLHMQIIQVGYALLAGFFLGWVYYYTKSIRSTIVMHILFNLFGSGIQTFLESGIFGDMSAFIPEYNAYSLLAEFSLILPAIVCFIFLRAMYKNSIRIDTRALAEEAVVVMDHDDPVADFEPDENAPSPFASAKEKEETSGDTADEQA